MDRKRKTRPDLVREHNEAVDMLWLIYENPEPEGTDAWHWAQVAEMLAEDIVAKTRREISEIDNAEHPMARIA